MKNFRLSVWAITCFIVIVAGVFPGCGSKDEGTKIKISSWGDLQENAILVDLIADFEKTHPGIQVELERIPFNEYVTKLLTQVAGGLAPDVIFVEVNNFTDLYLRGALEPLNSYMQADNFSLDGYYPQVVDRFTGMVLLMSSLEIRLLFVSFTIIKPLLMKLIFHIPLTTGIGMILSMTLKK